MATTKRAQYFDERRTGLKLPPTGYTFYFKFDDGLLTFPITPGELTIKTGSNNEVVNLINEGDVNILKSPSLIEVEFEARFPMRQYPYARDYINFKEYFDVFKSLKENKESFRFIVARTTPRLKTTWETNLLVALEEMELSENADEGDDVIITFKLKQYKDYGVVTLKKKKSGKSVTKKSTKKSTKKRDTKKTNKSKKYTVKRGDCLWTIAKKFYDSGSEWKRIYKANKSIIEKTAKKHGFKSSSNGHWIFPGCKLTIPAK